MILRILGLVLGISSLIYFVMYAICAGLTNKFTYFWLLFGGACVLFSVMYHRIINRIHMFPVWVKIAGSIVIGICILAIVAAEVIIISYGVATPKPGADYIIVLGAQVRGTTPSYSLAKRLDVACEYLKNNPDTKAILSGGQGEGEDITEALAMQKYLLARGIQEERMILEDKSGNTHENIKFSKEIISNSDAGVVLVTNDFHIFRSIQIAQKQGMKQVEGLGAPIKWYTIPNQYLREAFAVIKYFLCGQI